MTDWVLFLGRFHPLVLHLPIGLLSGAYLLTLAARLPRFARYEQAAGVLLQLGALGAVISAVLGYMLGLEGGYDARLVDLHRWSGIALGVASVVLAWMVRRRRESRAYLPAFTACMALMVWVGHLGGTLSHGEGYLLAHAPGPVRALFGAEPRSDGPIVIEDVERAAVRDQLVLPVLDASCTECHNPVKHNGDLDLTTAEGLLAGGENGAVISEEGALASELFRRVILPPDHEDAMPPSGRARLAPEDVELIGWWLDRGASPDATVGAMAPDARLLRLLRERFGRPDPLERVRIRRAGDRAVARANRGDFVVERVSEDGPYLRARLDPARQADERPTLDDLSGVRKHVIDLDLGDSGFDDVAAAALGDFPHLRRLALHNTAVTDEAMRELAGLAYLGSLNIHGTAVTAAGLAELSGLEHLESVYAWNSGVVSAELSGAGGVASRVRVDLGVDPDRYDSTPLPAPIVTVDEPLFATATTVSVSGSIPGAEVRYTVDGTDPSPESPLYTGPFDVTRSTRVRAIATKSGWLDSPIGEAVALHRGYPLASVRLSTSPNPEYPGEGGAGLGDGALGTAVFRSPEWVGYRERDLVATVDLGSVETVGEVTVSILENTGAWIFPPAAIEVSASTDGTAFRRAVSARYDGPGADRSPSQSFLRETFDPLEARWLRVLVRRYGPLPDWHPGAGQPSWLFVDEILVGPGPR